MILDFNEFNNINEAGNDTKAKAREQARIEAEAEKARSQRRATKVEIPKYDKPISSVEFEREKSGGRPTIKSYTGSHTEADSEYLTKKSERELEKERTQQAHIDSLFTKKDLPSSRIEPIFKGTPEEVRKHREEKEKADKAEELRQKLHMSAELRNQILTTPDFAATILPKADAIARQNAVGSVMYTLAHPGAKPEEPESRHVAAPKLNDEFSYIAEVRSLKLLGLNTSVIVANIDYMMESMAKEFEFLKLKEISIYNASTSGTPTFTLEMRFVTEYKGNKSARMSEEYLGLAGYYVSKTFGKFYFKGSAGYLSEPPRLKEGSTKISGEFDYNDNIDQTYVVKFKEGNIFKLMGAPQDIVVKDDMSKYLENAVETAKDPRPKRIMDLLKAREKATGESIGESGVFDFNSYCTINEQLLYENKCDICDTLMEHCCTNGLLVESGNRMCYVAQTNGKAYSQKLVDNFNMYVIERLGYDAITWKAFEMNGYLNIMMSING